ncbi:hypothetical protein CHU98_g1016 [Xylaria longipes]|nr:hypothetical protein CHU98_g1016 [Xylaria longipes]
MTPDWRGLRSLTTGVSTLSRIRNPAVWSTADKDMVISRNRRLASKRESTMVICATKIFSGLTCSIIAPILGSVPDPCAAKAVTRNKRSVQLKETLGFLDRGKTWDPWTYYYVSHSVTSSASRAIHWTYIMTINAHPIVSRCMPRRETVLASDRQAGPPAKSAESSTFGAGGQRGSRRAAWEEEQFPRHAYLIGSALRIVALAPRGQARIMYASTPPSGQPRVTDRQPLGTYVASNGAWLYASRHNAPHLAAFEPTTEHRMFGTSDKSCIRPQICTVMQPQKQTPGSDCANSEPQRRRNHDTTPGECHSSGMRFGTGICGPGERFSKASITNQKVAELTETVLPYATLGQERGDEREPNHLPACRPTGFNDPVETLLGKSAKVWFYRLRLRAS